MSMEAKAGLSMLWDGASCGPVPAAAGVQFVSLSSSNVVAVASLRVKRGPETHRTAAFNVEVGPQHFHFYLFIYLETR